MYLLISKHSCIYIYIYLFFSSVDSIKFVDSIQFVDAIQFNDSIQFNTSGRSSIRRFKPVAHQHEGPDDPIVAARLE